MSEWISVEDRLPETGKKVFAFYTNSSGKGRRVCSHYAPRYSIESNAESDDYDEYCEDDDTYYFMQGWWEQIDNWPDYSCCFVNEGEVTHWMHLPAPPAKGDRDEQP